MSSKSFKSFSDPQSPQKHAADPTAVESGVSLVTDLSHANLEDNDEMDDIISNPSPHRGSNSPLSTNRSRPQSQDKSLKRRAESMEGSRPGTHKARPIPQLPQPDAEAMPRDPDQDNPNIFVSLWHFKI